MSKSFFANKALKREAIALYYEPSSITQVQYDSIMQGWPDTLVTPTPIGYQELVSVTKGAIVNDYESLLLGCVACFEEHQDLVESVLDEYASGYANSILQAEYGVEQFSRNHYSALHSTIMGQTLELLRGIVKSTNSHLLSLETPLFGPQIPYTLTECKADGTCVFVKMDYSDVSKF